MKLTPVIAALRARCPYFENRVAGAAQFKNLPEVGKLRLPAAYVVPGDDSPGENKSQTDYWQELKEGFSVVVILSNGRDERGQFASYDVVDDVRQMLFKALLGWNPEACGNPITYDGGTLLDLNRHELIYQFDFSVISELTEDDTRQQDDLNSLDELQTLAIDVDYLDPGTPIKEIRPKMLKQHLDPIEKRGVLETLRRVISRLNEIFRYAATEELIEFNPADNLGQRFSKPKKQNMPALPPSELPRFLVALNNASIRLETRLLIEWQLLTWVRPGEAVRTRWSDIDIETSMWNIPAEFMKMKKPHKVPLSKESLRVLDSMKAISGHREWVFPSIKAPLNHMHEQTANAAIIRMGFGGELVAHGMRSIARTAAEECGKFRTDVLEAALAHSKKDEIIAAYNRAEYLTERVVLMQWWSDYVSSQKYKVIAA